MSRFLYSSVAMRSLLAFLHCATGIPDTIGRLLHDRAADLQHFHLKVIAFIVTDAGTAAFFNPLITGKKAPVAGIFNLSSKKGETEFIDRFLGKILQIAAGHLLRVLRNSAAPGQKQQRRSCHGKKLLISH